MNYTTEIVFALANRYHNTVEYCDEYGEPGYSTDKNGILLSNWNKWPDHLINALEKQYDLEYDDEWIISYETFKCYRTITHSYWWRPYYTVINSEVVGGDEIENDDYLAEQYINKLIDNPYDYNLFNVNLSKFGFTKLNTEPIEYPNNNYMDFWRISKPDYEFMYSHSTYNGYDIYGRETKKEYQL